MLVHPRRTRLGLGKGSSPKKQSWQELADWVAAGRTLVKLRDAARKSSKEYCADAAQHLEESIAATSRGINRLDAAIEALLPADEGLQRRAEIIRSVPGCGLLTAAVLCAELPELGQIGQAQAAALSARRCYPQLRAFYERLLAQRGPKLGKLVLVAVMRKLLRVLNSLLHHDRLWQAEAPAQGAAA